MSAKGLYVHMFPNGGENRAGDFGLKSPPLFSRFSACGPSCPVTSDKVQTQDRNLHEKEPDHAD